jgi:hypothetical protein
MVNLARISWVSMPFPRTLTTSLAQARGTATRVCKLPGLGFERVGILRIDAAAEKAHPVILREATRSPRLSVRRGP